MPKLKTKSGAAKRFKPTASGRFKHRQSFKNHILTKKPAKRKRHLRALSIIKAVDEESINRMLPYV